MPLSDTPVAYGSLSKLVHWLTAGLILCLFGLAWIFINIDESPTQRLLVTIHRSLGTILLVVAVARIPWRIANRFPRLPANVGAVEHVAARVVEIFFYAALVAMPLSGWVFTNAFGDEASFFGLFTLPRIADKNVELRNAAWMIHRWGSYAVLAALALHVAGALVHHVLKGDDVLRRMLPGAAAAGDGRGSAALWGASRRRQS